MSESRRSPLAWFFGVVARRETWLNLLYLALSFPLGLFYFVFLVVFLSLGVSLAIIWVGIFILGLTAACSWAFAAFERSLADGLLGTHLLPSPQPWKRADGVWPRIKAHFGSGATWKDLAFLILKFPLGLLSFCIVVTLGATSLALATAPIYYRYASSTDTHGVFHHGLNFGVWYLDRLWQALLLVPIGLLLLFISLHAFNGLAAMWRAIARGLLPPDVRPQPSAAPATAGWAPPVTGWAPPTTSSAQPAMPAAAQPQQTAPSGAPRQDTPTRPSQPTPAPAGPSPQPGTAWPQWPGYPASAPSGGYPPNAAYPPDAAYPPPPAGADTAQAPSTDPAEQPSYGWPPYPPQAYPQQPYPPQAYPPQAYPQQPAYPTQADQPAASQTAGQPAAPRAGDSPAPPTGAPWPGAQWPGAPWPQWSPLFGPPPAGLGGPAAAPTAAPAAAPTAAPAEQPPAAPAGPATPAQPSGPDATPQTDRPADQATTAPATDDHGASQDEQTASQDEQTESQDEQTASQEDQQ